MRKLIIGFGTGVTITAAALLGYANANESSGTNCTVNLSYGRQTLGQRCYYPDEVMTGMNNGYLLCSRLSVQCDHGDADQRGER